MRVWQTRRGSNPVYRGLIRHKDKSWPGLQPPIIDESLWEQVQRKLQAASARRRGRQNPAQMAATTTALMSLFRDETGDLLTPTHTQRHGRRLR